jgi:hypothetical protein
MEGNKNKIIPLEIVESKIFFIRAEKVMMDSDLAVLYEVETKMLVRAVKRNIDRFPEDFMFRLKKEEYEILRYHFGTSKQGGRRYSPYVFTEQGIAMLSGVLRSKRAAQVNIAIMRAFVNMRKFINSYEGLARKISEIESKYDKKITEIFRLIDVLSKDEKNNKIKEIGFKC